MPRAAAGAALDPQATLHRGAADAARLENYPGRGFTCRSYTSFSPAVKDRIDARVWSGIHFRTADEAGKQVARYRAKHYFHRLHCGGDKHGFGAEHDFGSEYEGD